MLLVYVSFNFPNLFVFLDLQLLFWYFSDSSNRDMSGPQGPIELWCKARRHTCKLPGLMASLQRGLYQLRETAYKRGLGENKNFFALFIVSLWQDEKLQVSFAWVWTWNNPLKTLIPWLCLVNASVAPVDYCFICLDRHQLTYIKMFPFVSLCEWRRPKRHNRLGNTHRDISGGQAVQRTQVCHSFWAGNTAFLMEFLVIIKPEP